MSGTMRLKKPRREIEIVSMEEDENSQKSSRSDDESESVSSRDEEDALVLLFEHRSKEVQHLRTRVLYYQSQLEEAERKLQDTEGKLARARRKASHKSWNSSLPSSKKVKVERRSTSPSERNEDSSHYLSRSKPQLLIPNLNPKSSWPKPVAETGAGVPSSPSDSPIKAMVDRSRTTHDECDGTKSQAISSKRKAELRDCNELVPLVCTCSSPSMIHCNASAYISSQHKRKLRSLAVCPFTGWDDTLVAATGQRYIHLGWKGKGFLLYYKHSALGQYSALGATCLSSTSCLSPKQRRWPEDIAWHPKGDRLLAVYGADGGDNQISVIDLNKSQGDRVTFLEQKPHVKGIINSIAFMPWDDTYFATGGSDHAVMFWTEKDRDKVRTPKTLHRNLHSSAVMGVAGMQHKQIVVSAGKDKRIIGYDVLAGRADYKHQIESKCMSVVPNPYDFNLFMVQTGTPERQLRLFDIRLNNSELHAFGWKQESSEQQSALINQAWSPDGLHISSGSADPMIHIFDIRYNSNKPSQSLKAHQKRVFKAEWHKSLPFLISISSDLSIGLHKISI